MSIIVLATHFKGAYVKPLRIVPCLVVLSLLVGPTSARASSSTSAGNDLLTFHADVDDWEVETQFNLDDPEVSFIANKYNTSLERALEIANWQSEVDDLVEALPLDFFGNFASAQLRIGGKGEDENSIDGHILLDLAFKDPANPEVDRAVGEIAEAGKRVATDQSVAVRQVPRSLAELDAERAALVAQVGEDARIEIEYDINAGELHVAPSEPRIVWPNVDCPTVTGGKLDGGRAINFDDPDDADCLGPGAACTSAFPARLDARYGVMTAGHCFDPEWYPATGSGFVTTSSVEDVILMWVSLPDQIYADLWANWYDLPDDDDIGFVARKWSDTGFPSQIWKWDTQEWRLITKFAASPRPLGFTVCLSASANSEQGAATYCGEVIDEYTEYDSGELVNLKFTEVDFDQGQFNIGYGPGRGGSGGPFFWSGTVYGIHSNTDVATNGCPNPQGLCHRLGRYQRTESIQASARAAAGTNDFHFICSDGSGNGTPCSASS